MAWLNRQEIGPLLWGRQEPYVTPFSIVGTELVRFQQDYSDYHRPWRGWILVEQFHEEHGIMKSTRLKLTKEQVVREFRFPPEMDPEQEAYKLLISPRGRWTPEANWSLFVEQWF